MPRRSDDNSPVSSRSSELEPLARQTLAVRQQHRDVEPFEHERPEIARAVTRRLRSLAIHELRNPQTRIGTPAWSHGLALPGFIVAQRWAGGDAFGCSRQIAELDTSVRRANAMLESLLAGEQELRWPLPMRPERGGLWLMDADYGSLDALWTVYGALVATATSTPVSLASFASLAWTSSRSAWRIARNWRVRVLEPDELSQRPSAANSGPTLTDRGDTWQERTTKRLLPVLEQAVQNGSGVDFRATGPGGEIRFIVPPRSTESPSAEDG
jgi:hypothetical protein